MSPRPWTIWTNRTEHPVPRRYYGEVNEGAVRSRRYAVEDVDRGLLAMVVCAGNSAEASRRLAEQGLEVPERTLRPWRHELYPGRYAALAREHGHELEQLIQRSREIADRAAQVERLAIDTAEQELRSGKTRDASAVARNLATVRGISTDKLLAFSGRPTAIVESRTGEEALAKLRDFGLIVEGSAVDDERG